MRILTINLPDTIDLNDKEGKMALASKLYEMGKLTLGQSVIWWVIQRKLLWNC